MDRRDFLKTTAALAALGVAAKAGKLFAASPAKELAVRMSASVPARIFTLQLSCSTSQSSSSASSTTVIFTSFKLMYLSQTVSSLSLPI